MTGSGLRPQACEVPGAEAGADSWTPCPISPFSPRADSRIHVPLSSVLEASALGSTHLWINAPWWSQHSHLLHFSSGVSEVQGGKLGLPQMGQGPA